MTTSLNLDDIRSGLLDVVAGIERAGLTGATIRIVGGAAVKMYFPSRGMTADVDARLEPQGAVLDVADEVGHKRGWPPGWLNDAAAKFIPDYGVAVEWHALYESTHVRVEVAPPDALLAMKLKAMERRGARDVGDVHLLLGLCGLQDIEDVEDLIDRFFPGDALTSACRTTVSALLAARAAATGDGTALWGAARLGPISWEHGASASQPQGPTGPGM